MSTQKTTKEGSKTRIDKALWNTFDEEVKQEEPIECIQKNW